MEIFRRLKTAFRVGVVALVATALSAQSGVGFPTLPPGHFVSYSPAALGVNALLEPGSSTSAVSNIIDTRGVKQATIIATCTQGNWTINLTSYAEDGTTALSNASQVVTAIPAAGVSVAHFGSEVGISTNNGTPFNLAVFPQRALSFSFTNASATPGTCTARLFLSY